MTDPLSAEEAAEQSAALVADTLVGAPSAVAELTAHLAKAQGKGVRTRLVMASAMDEDGLVPVHAVRVAAAIELFHLATLVHDDVIDDAPVRRGVPTLHTRYGVKQAVICGDYILCLATSLIAPLQEQYGEYADLLATFSRALSRTCLGELTQLRNNRNLNLDTLSYLRIISGKTSALFYVSAYAGGLVARCPRREARSLARFGRYLGMVFQIVDDCKDFEFSQGQAGKPVCKDIAEGVVTLPLILAMAKEPALRDLAAAAFDGDAARLAAQVREAGGTDLARQTAFRYGEKAARLLEPFHAAKRHALNALLEKALCAANAF